MDMLCFCMYVSCICLMLNSHKYFLIVFTDIRIECVVGVVYQDTSTVVVLNFFFFLFFLTNMCARKIIHYICKYHDRIFTGNT